MESIPIGNGVFGSDWNQHSADRAELRLLLGPVAFVVQCIPVSALTLSLFPLPFALSLYLFSLNLYLSIYLFRSYLFPSLHMPLLKLHAACDVEDTQQSPRHCTFLTASSARTECSVWICIAGSSTLSNRSRNPLSIPMFWELQ